MPLYQADPWRLTTRHTDEGISELLLAGAEVRQAIEPGQPITALDHQSALLVDLIVPRARYFPHRVYELPVQFGTLVGIGLEQALDLHPGRVVVVVKGDNPYLLRERAEQPERLRGKRVQPGYCGVPAPGVALRQVVDQDEDEAQQARAHHGLTQSSPALYRTPQMHIWLL